MPCLLFVFGAGFPRVVLVLLWLFSSWFSGVYANILVPILGLIPWMLDGVFIGATRTADMRNMMLLAFVIYAAAAAALVPAFGNHGLWAAMLISFVARGATLAWKYPALERAAGTGGAA